MDMDRDTNGKFAPGNQLARGHANPHAKKIRRLYNELLRCVKIEDIRQVIENLLRQAKKDDFRSVQATAELLDRILGRVERIAIEMRDEDDKKSVWFSFAPPGQAPAPQQGGLDVKT